MTISTAGAVLAVVLAGTYTSFWYNQAAVSRHTFEQTVADINARGHVLDKTGTVLTYSRLETNGYPFFVTLQVDEPVFRIPVSALLQQLPLQHARQNMSRSSWIETLHAQRLTLSGNLLNPNAVKARIFGPIRESSNLPGAAAWQTVTTAGDFTCNVQAPPPPRDGATAVNLASTTGSFDCLIDRAQSVDAASGTLLAKTDQLTLAVSNQPSTAASRVIHLAFDVNGQRYFPAVDARTVQIAQQGARTIGAAPPSGELLAPSAYGETDEHFDIGYDGPVQGTPLNFASSPLHVDINRFDVHNALRRLSLVMHLATTCTDDVKSDSFVFHSHDEIEERYDALLRQSYHTAAGGASNLERLRAQKMLGSMPNIHSLSPITSDIDVHGNFLNSFKDHAAPTFIGVDTLALNVAPYGIVLHGSAENDGTGPIVNFTVQARNAKQMVSDIGRFAQNAESVFITKAHKPLITTGRIRGLQSFLYDIADHPERTQPNLTIQFQQSPGNPPIISGHGMLEVMTAFGRDFSARSAR